MKKGIIKATAVVFAISLVAKCIGFVKSIIEASYYGTSIEMDAYNVSSGFVSNILYMLTTSIAVAFIPLYIQQKEENEERKRFATRTITSLSLISIVLIIVLILFAPLIIKLIAPSFNSDERELAVRYFRILSLGVMFSLGANMYTSVLNAEKRFGFSSLSSIINSVVLIFSIVLLSKSLGVWALAFAMPISFLFQWVALYFVGNRYASISLKYGLKNKSIKVLIVQAAPILLSQATVEINQVVDRALLSGVEVGALTAVSYSAVLYQFVTTIISTPVSTVMFTELSEAGADRDSTRIKKTIQESFRILVLICIPVIVVSFFSSTDVVRFVYGHGKFNDDAIRQCADGLKMYVLCLLPVCIKSILSRAYYSLNDTKRPMVFGFLEVAVNILLSIILVRFFGIMGVIGATAIASYLFIIVMLIDFNHRYVMIIQKEELLSYWKPSVGLVAILAVFMAMSGFFHYSSLVNFLMRSTLGFVIYIMILLLVRDETVIQLYSITKQAIKNKMKK